MTVTTFQQTTHPELSATVTQITQDIILQDFDKWIDKVASLARKHDYIISISAYRPLKNYHKQGYTPKQAVNKYFL